MMEQSQALQLQILEQIVQSIDALVYVIELQTCKILYANTKAKETFGEVDGKICYQVLQKDQNEVCHFCSLATHRHALKIGATFKWENNNEISRKTYLFSDKIIQWMDGRLVKVQIGLDISQLKKLESEIAKQHEETFSAFEALTNATIEGLVVLDDERRCIRVNHVAPKLFGYLEDEMIGMHALALIAPESVQLVRNMLLNENQEPYEATLMRKDGTTFAALLRGKNITLAGKSMRVSAIMDISSIKEKEKEISKLAYYDPLTSLPNRMLFRSRLNELMQKSIRDLSYGLLMFVDLDHFKTINDTKGHLVGDKILVECAHRLVAITREYDVVARLGGDEFVLLIDTQTTDRQVAVSIARIIAVKILVELKKPFLVDQYDFRISASIGIAVFADEEYALDDLLKYADSAMYHAKERERGTYSFFNPQLQSQMEQKAIMLERLHLAFENHNIKVHYQKQVDQNAHVIGVEALARWHDEVLGFVSPAEFIPLAEESGLIIRLGEYVLEEAAELIRLWSKDVEKQAWVVSVNVSLKQFERSNFEETLKRIIEIYQIDPCKIDLELTESMLIKNSQKALEKIQNLKSLGVRLSIDDFGTGYSSLAYLKKLPVDNIKIDRSFVLDLLHDSSDETIVETILSLGKKFGFKVTAEGVETKEIWEKLIEMGCEYFQGYYFAKPLESKAL